MLRNIVKVTQLLSGRAKSQPLFFITLYRGEQTFPVKGQKINTLGFISHMVASVTMTQLCWDSTCTATGNTKGTDMMMSQ